MTAEKRVHDDADTLAEAVAEALIERLASIQASGRVPSVCLTGGTIAGLVHRKLASSLNGFDVDWDEVDFWWGDERYVDSHSDDRNARQARGDLLNHVDVDPERVHEMPALDSGLPLEEAAEAYAAELHEHGGGAFDVVMLGLGPDGHIASLFPGSSQIDVDDRVAVAVTDSPKPPPERISLTFGALNRTHAVWFLVSGKEKADAVARSMGDLDLHAAPATGVTGQGEVLWWLDRAASGAE
ncbi:6-phosphogluconolactonase [Nocardioides jensenii]|uniref:6-phosphogluconolactonase n=1 Tax=Nocardioides jensenii TaxID=1843 RepID=UPI0008295CD9|nr:6-phosphogluconolactonase [Nocardioides jensenii]